MLKTVQMKKFSPDLYRRTCNLDLCYSNRDDDWLCCSGTNVFTLLKNNTALNDIVASDDFVITAMALSPENTENETLALCKDKGVFIYVFPDCCSDNIHLHYAVRKDLDITHIAYEKDGAHIFLSSKGPDVEIYSFENFEMECIGNVKMEMKLQTFDTGVTTFAVNDDSSLVCIVDDSSTVLLYSLTTNSNAIFVGNKLLSDKKTFVGNKLENVAKEITSKASVRAGLEFNSFNITGFKVSWLPHKELLAVAVPSTKGRIILFNRKGGKNKLSKYEDTPIWEEIHIVTSETSQLTHGTEDINLAVFSPNGRYLATADNAGIVLIWEISSQDLLNMILMSGSFVPINMLNTLPIGPLFDLVWGQKDGDNYLMLASASSSGVVEGVVDCCRGRCLPTGDYAERVVEEVVDSNRGRYIGNGEYTMTAGRTRARTASASGVVEGVVDCSTGRCLPTGEVNRRKRIRRNYSLRNDIN